MGFSEWSKRLDDRFYVPLDRKISRPWMRHPLARLGMTMAVIFGGGGLVRLILGSSLRTSSGELVVYASVGAVGAVMTLIGRHLFNKSGGR